METVLTERQRHQLMAVLQELDPTAPAEQRKHPRRKVLLNMWIRKSEGKKARTLHKVLLENVSMQGVGILSQDEMTKEDKFVVPLEFQEGGGWLVLCEVRNCRRLVSGQFKVGARFIDRIENDDGNAQIPADWK